MREIVIDTNVFEHCNNEQCEWGEPSLKLLRSISESDITICLDSRFDPVESNCDSWIGVEYRKRIRLGMIGYPFLLMFLQGKDKVRQISMKDLIAEKRKITRRIKNKVDVVFATVSTASGSKVLISNDYTDFDSGVRRWMNSEFSVSIKDAKQLIA